MTSNCPKIQQAQCDVSPAQTLSLKIKIIARYFKTYLFIYLLIKSNSLYLVSPMLNKTLCFISPRQTNTLLCF